MKKPTIIVISIIGLVLVVYAIYSLFHKPVTYTPTPSPDTTIPSTSSSTTSTTKPTTSTTPKTGSEVIGQSVGGRNITAYHYGTGASELVFVGGIHGGYEWNTVLLATQLKNYLDTNASAIPAGVRVTVIPVMNPDGLYKVVGTDTGNFTQGDIPDSGATVVAGRYNGNGVDLNRNFDCDWQAKGKWQSTTVSGGSAAFSEPESQAIQKYINSSKPAAVVVYYSAAGGVYASNCHGGVSAQTENLLTTYAQASGYTAHDSFDFYATTGDMTNWLAKIGVPAMSVLLTNHADTEWSKNLAGFKALVAYYAK